MTPQRPFPLPPVRQQGRDYGITPVFQSDPMQPRQDVESFDLTRNFGPSRSLVTGDRSLTRNPNGRGGAPQLSPMGDVIGKRGMTPERRMEVLSRRAWTRGDDAGVAKATLPLLNIAQQQQGMDFAAKQNETNFQQGLVMNDLHAQSQQARDEQMRLERFHQWSADQDAQTKRDAADREWDLTKFGLEQGSRAMEAERERAEREQERGRVPIMGTVPIPGTDYAGTYADGRPMGNVPVARPASPLPPGMVPRSAERNGVRYGPEQSKPAPPPKVQEFKTADGLSEYRQWDEAKGGWRKVKFIDEDGDGVDDREQQGGAAPADGRGAAWKGLGGR